MLREILEKIQEDFSGTDVIDGVEVDWYAEPFWLDDEDCYDIEDDKERDKCMDSLKRFGVELFFKKDPTKETIKKLKRLGFLINGSNSDWVLDEDKAFKDEKELKRTLMKLGIKV